MPSKPASKSAKVAPKAKAAKRAAAPKAVKAAATESAAKPAAAPKAKAKAAAPASAAAPAAAASSAADVVITSSKVCQAFAKRADAIAAAVKAAGFSVSIDTQPALGRNPDRGTFAVVARGKTLVSLPAMPRPFTAMKALDIYALERDVLAALKK